MELHICDQGLPLLLQQQLADANLHVVPEQGKYGVIHYRVGRERPQRGFGQVDDFPAGSQGAAFFNNPPDVYVVICRLEAEKDSQTWTAYDVLINSIRSASRYGNPTVNWHFSHDPLFDETFSAYINNCNLELPELTWLRDTDGNVRSAYPSNRVPVVDPNNLPIGVFSSVANYCRNFIPALLMERQEDMAQFRELYNSGRRHRLVFTHMSEDRSACHIRINRTDFQGALSVPSISSAVKIQLPELGEDFNDQDMQLEGRVWGSHHEGFDFLIQANAPEHVIRRMKARNMEHNDSPNGDWDAILDVVYSNHDIQLKLQNLVLLYSSRFAELQTIGELPIVDNHHRGKFELHSIIGEYRPDIWSPVLRKEYEQRRDVDHRVKERTLEVVDHLLDYGEFDEYQYAFIRACIDEGVPGNIAILQGRPGSGKSATLAYLVIIIMLFNLKVIITGQSNVAPSALLEKVRNTINAHKADLPELALLLKRMTRLQSPKREEFNTKCLLSDVQHAKIEEDCIANHVLAYINDPENKDDRDVDDFHRHMLAKRNGTVFRPAGANRGLSAVTSRIHKRIVDRMLLIAPTTFAASALKDIGYQVDVVAVDEASQATEPDVIGVLLGQSNLLLVLLAGDEKQFGPVIKSLQARSNPWALILAVSLLTRLKTYPHVRRFELVNNYRSHDQLVYMPSQIFYNGSMVPGTHAADHWNTQIDRGIAILLNNRDIFPRDHYRIRAMRQIFFNVRGLPVKEDGGHSLWNPHGVQAVAQAALMCLQMVGVNVGDIGIITHYTEDKHRLHLELASLGIEEMDVEVSTVNAFQGKEKQIILIHFVVANEGDNPFGFVSNTNRLCVATTRAKRLQLMFGNLDF